MQHNQNNDDRVSAKAHIVIFSGLFAGLFGCVIGTLVDLDRKDEKSRAEQWFFKGIAIGALLSISANVLYP